MVVRSKFDITMITLACVLGICIASYCAAEVYTSQRALAAAEKFRSSGGAAFLYSFWESEVRTSSTIPFGIRLTKLYSIPISEQAEKHSGKHLNFERSNCSGIKVMRHFDRTLGKEIADLGSIRVLSLECTDLECHDISIFSNRCRLEVVHLGYTRCGDHALELLCACPTIKELRCNGLSIGDTSVSNINRLPAVEQLDITATKITPDGIRELCKIPTLTSLRIGGINITPSLVHELRQEFPRLAIYDSEAY